MNNKSGFSAFISHSNFDKPFVRQLGNDLEAHGIRTWIDEAEIKPGDDLISKITVGIKDATHVLIVLSPNSIISKWVREETHAAQIRAIGGDAKLIPVLVGELNANEIPILLQSRLYVDFREAGQYQDQLKHLLSAFDVDPLDKEIDNANILLPRIEDVNLLRGHVASGYGLEILVINPSAKEFHINHATIGSYRPDTSNYIKPPPVYTYNLNLKIEATSSPCNIPITGSAKEPSDSWGRPASGIILISGNTLAFEVSCPIYLNFSPKDRALIRFVFDEFRFKRNKMPRKRRDGQHSFGKISENAPTFGEHSNCKMGETWVVLAGDLKEPIAARVTNHELLGIFYNVKFPSQSSIQK